MMTDEQRALIQQVVEKDPAGVLTSLIRQPSLTREERRVLEHAAVDLQYAIDVQAEHG